MDEDGVCPRLTDGVVMLNAYTLDDIEAQLAGQDDEQARRFDLHPTRATVESVTAFFRRHEEDWRTGGTRRNFAVRDIGSGALVGGCEVRLKADRRAEMSWWVFPGWRRRGLATRAAVLVLDYAFGKLGVTCIDVYVEPDNLASCGVARKAGFEEKAILAGHGEFGDERRDMVWYSRLATVDP